MITPHKRRIVKALHWSSALMIAMMVKGGTANPVLLWVFVGIIAVWAALTLTTGLLGKPGPKLSPGLRRAYPWMHRGLHVLLGLTAVAILFRLLGAPLVWLDAWVMLLLTLAAGTLHGLFHFWRHTALYDRALHLITPRVLHKWL